MAIKKNPSGRSATRDDGVGTTGGAGDGRGAPRRSAPLAQRTPSVPKRLPAVNKPMKKGAR